MNTSPKRPTVFDDIMDWLNESPENMREFEEMIAGMHKSKPLQQASDALVAFSNEVTDQIKDPDVVLKQIKKLSTPPKKS